MSNAVNVEEIEKAMIVRFNRPEVRSPLSIDVLGLLKLIVDDIAARPDIDRLVFAGTGSVFASGADLREIAGVDADGAAEFAIRGQALMSSIARLEAMSIAAINGVCFGGALDLALACAVRIASSDAVFAHPGADLGIMTGWGGTQRLPRLVGHASACEMFFTAKRVGAEEALRIGLIDEISPDPVQAAIDHRLDL